MSTLTLSTLTIAAMAFFAGCTSTCNNRASMSAVSEGGYICPLTGETLPCSDCCPLNQELASQQETTRLTNTSAHKGYECPITGEILPCPKCCPLNNRAN